MTLNMEVWSAIRAEKRGHNPRHSRIKNTKRRTTAIQETPKILASYPAANQRWFVPTDIPNTSEFPQR